MLRSSLVLLALVRTSVERRGASLDKVGELGDRERARAVVVEPSFSFKVTLREFCQLCKKSSFAKSIRLFI